MAAAANGSMPFLQHNGRIRLICNDELEPTVLYAIRSGITTREEALLKAFPPQRLAHIPPDDSETVKAIDLLT